MTEEEMDNVQQSVKREVGNSTILILVLLVLIIALLSQSKVCKNYPYNYEQSTNQPAPLSQPKIADQVEGTH